LFELYQPMVISEAAGGTKRSATRSSCPVRAGVSRDHRYVRDVEELVIGARVALVRRDFDALWTSRTGRSNLPG
jgi:hypothetical protein